MLRIVPWLLVVAGAVLRLDQYFAGRSLWLDEAMLAVNFHDRGWRELLDPPLDYHDRLPAPPGFLVVTALLVRLLGPSDPVLRLIPLVGGLLSLPVFVGLARRALTPAAVPIAVLLFALSPRLVYYASEFKQYSTDVTVASALLLLALPVVRGPVPGPGFAALTAAGVAAFWFSHPATFVLGGVWITLAVSHRFGRRRPSTLALGMTAVAWLASFTAVYVLTVRNIPPVSPVGDYLLHFWRSQGAFLHPSLDLATLTWVPRRLAALLGYADLPLALGAAVVLLGCASMLARARPTAAMLLLPPVLAMVVSPLERYPFGGRMLLFLFPALHLLLAEGVARVRIRRWAFPGVVLLAAVAQVALLVGLVRTPLYQRKTVQEFEPVLAQVSRRLESADAIYLYHWAEPAFRHYAARHGLSYDDCRLITPISRHRHLKEIDFFRQRRGLQPVAPDTAFCVLGVSEFYQYARADLDRLRGRGRVWFLFSHADAERPRFVEHLDRVGRRLDTVTRRGAHAYLYDL